MGFFGNNEEGFEITPTELAANREKYRLIDVREPYEWEIADIAGADHIPMRDVGSKLDSLPRDQDIVIYCRSGGRSGRVVEYLRGAGYTKVKNLVGGINRWAREVDPEIRTY